MAKQTLGDLQRESTLVVFCIGWLASALTYGLGETLDVQGWWLLLWGAFVLLGGYAGYWVSARVQQGIFKLTEIRTVLDIHEWEEENNG